MLSTPEAPLRAARADRFSSRQVLWRAIVHGDLASVESIIRHGGLVSGRTQAVAPRGGAVCGRTPAAIRCCGTPSPLSGQTWRCCSCAASRRTCREPSHIQGV